MSTNGDERPRRSAQLTGARELMLIQDLAVGDMSHADLAEKYEVAEHTVTNFAWRKKHRIAEVAQNQVDELVGLWIARKELRVATYQVEVERNLELINDMVESLSHFPIPPETDKITRLQAVILKALKDVAVEAGQVRAAGDQDDRPVVRHVVEGLDAWGEE